MKFGVASAASCASGDFIRSAVQVSAMLRTYRAVLHLVVISNPTVGPEATYFILQIEKEFVAVNKRLHNLL